METILLMIAMIICVILVIMLNNKLKPNKLARLMSISFMILFIWCAGIFAQKISIENNSSIEPIYFDYITYIGICFLFPCMNILSFYYKDEKTSKKKWWILLFIVPLISILSLWTNDFHYLFYKIYSVKFSETEYGIMFYVNTIYTYSLAAIFIIRMLKISIEKSGFFTMPTALIVIGSIIPLITNVLGTAKIINISIYVTPMLFCITLVLYWIAIFKYKAFNITPIAFKTVIDTMSDAFVVISDDGTMIESNKTFRDKFGEVFEFKENENLFEVFDKSSLVDLDKLKKQIAKTRKNAKSIIQEYHLNSKKLNRYFELDIQPITTKRDKNQYIGTLLLFKDITQHKLDIKEIEEKQDIIVKQQQLVSIGELAGGVAHDINTPISAIKTGILMLNTAENITPDQKEILQRMDNCATKIINIVNSMRNQIRNLGSDNVVKFKVSDVINDAKIITYHEVSKNKSKVEVDIKDDLYVKGDPTKLGQVMTNLIVNAAQAYKDKEQGVIEVIVEGAPGNKVMIKVIDHAGGFPEDIKPYVFKNILTTKGTSGTGLGLYLAYSVIKGNFNGEIDFDSKTGIGTTFYITIPKA